MIFRMVHLTYISFYQQIDLRFTIFLEQKFSTTKIVIVTLNKDQLIFIWDEKSESSLPLRCVSENTKKRNILPRPWFGHTAKQKPTTNSRLHREKTKPPGHKMLLVTHIRADYVALEKNNSDGYMYIYTKRRRQLFSAARSYVFVLAEVEERPSTVLYRQSCSNLCVTVCRGGRTTK